MQGLRKLFDSAGQRRPARAVWLDLPSPGVARIAAGSGFDLAVIDREHGAIGIETAVLMTDTLSSRGVPVLSRLPELSLSAAQQALDAGADGILVPRVESAEAARLAADAARYPPAGRRGAALAVIAATEFGRRLDYALRWNARAFVAVQIESLAGRAAAPAIAAVPGVDMLFFGPFDYAVEAGLDPEADRMALAAIFAEIAGIAHGAGRHVGVFPWPGAAPEVLDAADLVVCASDVGILRAGFDTAAVPAPARLTAAQP